MPDVVPAAEAAWQTWHRNAIEPWMSGDMDRTDLSHEAFCAGWAAAAPAIIDATEAARLAYEAYVAAKPHGETALDWDELDDAYIAAWVAAVAAAAPVIAAQATTAERERLLLAVRHTCACQPCKDAVAALTGDADGTR